MNVDYEANTYNQPIIIMKNKPNLWRWFAGMAIISLGLAACDSEEAIMPDQFDNAVATVNPQTDTRLTAEAAINVAEIFHGGQNGSGAPVMSRSSEEIETINDENGTPLAYIINYEDGGWVIVSAIKTYHPILAYSEVGSFSLDRVEENSGLAMWIDETSHAIALSDNLEEDKAQMIALEWLAYEPQTLSGGLPGGNTPEAIACRNRLKYLNDTYYSDGWTFTTLPEAAVNIPRVYENAAQYGSPTTYTIVGIQDCGTYEKTGPLTTTNWDQGVDYSALCPNQWPAGCVPVAMAQIMKFHAYPPSFAWEEMQDNIATYATQKLLVDIGAVVHVDYGPDGSPASNEDAVAGFIHYGYDAVLKPYSPTELYSMLSAHKSPFYMYGMSANSVAHAWVCDGVSYRYEASNYYAEYLKADNTYDNLGLTSISDPEILTSPSSSYQFHMNWGGGDIRSGWYGVSDFPENVGAYNYFKSVIYVKR